MSGDATEPRGRDLRPLALLLFALCLLILAAARKNGLFLAKAPSSAPKQAVWRSGPSGPGLYLESSPSASEPANYSELPARLRPLFFQPIPINQADEELLTTIPGVGPVLARRILEFREQHGMINSLEDLDAVKGIGPSKLSILREYLVAD